MPACRALMNGKCFFLMIILMSIILVSQLGWAAGLNGLPSEYPRTFDTFGLIDSIDLAKRTAVINDELVTFDDKSIIHAPNRGVVTLSSLRPGQLVAYQISRHRNQRVGQLRQLWIMPSHISLQDMFAAQQAE